MFLITRLLCAFTFGLAIADLIEGKGKPSVYWLLLFAVLWFSLWAVEDAFKQLRTSNSENKEES